ncbi:hypothetical protein DICVIV_08531 [Dictyocaulus viviparus]|uniref:Uncharacterized protein n=1 Tax=Dictyocaulus viviparus TaxID=29172 RepID=A0A0D8XNT3_DICVI|nr:hypothetical protein DICVIV_08531 [Dictyocaulus viviparus]
MRLNEGNKEKLYLNTAVILIKYGLVANICIKMITASKTYRLLRPVAI